MCVGCNRLPTAEGRNYVSQAYVSIVAGGWRQSNVAGEVKTKKAVR